MKNIRARRLIKTLGQGTQAERQINSIGFTSPQLRNIQPISNTRNTMLNINNHTFINKRTKYTKEFRNDLDPRDREVLLPFETQFNISNFQKDNQKDGTKLINSFEYFSLRRDVFDYISEVCQIVNSITFQLLNSGHLSEDQAKALASKNILTNIQSVLTEIKKQLNEYQLVKDLESEQLMLDLTRCIDEELKEVLSELSCHYPQATQVGETARMKEIIADVDRSQDQYNNLIFINDYNLWRQQPKVSPERYTGYVMEVINSAINVTSLPFSTGSDQTIFQKFHQFSERLFYVCQHNKFSKVLNQIDGKQKIEQQKTASKLRSEVAKHFARLFNQSKENHSTSNPQFLEGGSRNETIQQMRSRHKYGIVQKIPNYVKPFKDNDIISANFKVRHSSVLRIMTKWAEYLQEIFQRPQIHVMQRIYDFKVSSNLETLTRNDKEKLCQSLKRQYGQVKRQFNELKEKNILFQSHILSEIEPGTTYLKRFSEVRSASSQINAILIEFTRKYLCVLIHYLFKAGQMDSNRHVNLVAFRVGDLLRSKLQCNESSFINIIKTLIMLDQSKEMEGKFKLVRIKNKLSQNDNNVLINYMFLGKVQCELQLSIQDLAKKDKNYYSFCHFLYELTRGKFGVLTQFATIISQHDPIVSSSKDIYYRPKHYQKIASENKYPHSIYKKNKNIYKCQKCRELKIKERINLFVESQNICNKCIVKGEDPESKLNQCESYIVNQLLLQNGQCRIKNYENIEDGKFVLSIKNGRMDNSVEIFTVWENKNERKLFMIHMNEEIMNPENKRINCSRINYFDINRKKKNKEELQELTYIVDQNILRQICQIYYRSSTILSRHWDLLDQFQRFRLQKSVIKSIKIKSQIIDFREDPWKLPVLKNVARAYDSGNIQWLRYKKCNILDYKHIKKINLRDMGLAQAPQFLKYVDGGIQMDLCNNQISEISFQKSSRLQKLFMGSNQLKGINLTKCFNLKELYLFQNNIVQINLNSNINLAVLNLRQNQLTSIGLTKNINLQKIDLTKCSLKQIDLSKNTSLTQLILIGNSLRSIDLSNNLKLKFINLYGNSLALATIWASLQLNIGPYSTLVLESQSSQNCKGKNNIADSLGNKSLAIIARVKETSLLTFTVANMALKWNSVIDNQKNIIYNL